MGTVENILPLEQDLRTKARALVLKKTVRSLGGETSEGACLDLSHPHHHGAQQELDVAPSWR